MCKASIVYTIDIRIDPINDGNQDLMQIFSREVCSNIRKILIRFQVVTPSPHKLRSTCQEQGSAKKWLNEHGHDFYQSGMNKFILWSDECLSRFDG
ncbi:hypothetical protein AVEN_206720-1 [Araneus ventricosus]|uniref:Uncharacterized protein n=1 Tax=Araneus ventricosus TaxID=182803 RepID=A0A4Y2M8Y3_ARAVE|nr:hypothetical protein AVEN_206720-1 [Araneus ventricosus]